MSERRTIYTVQYDPYAGVEERRRLRLVAATADFGPRRVTVHANYGRAHLDREDFETTKTPWQASPREAWARFIEQAERQTANAAAELADWTARLAGAQRALAKLDQP